VVSDKTPHAVCVKIVRLLREERRRKKFSKYEVAMRCGLSEQMIGYVERGLRQPSLETTVRLAAGLKVDLGSIIKQAHKIVSRKT